jgi:hypothetical protein
MNTQPPPPPVYPILERGNQGLELTHSGMTLLDYYAGQILPSVLDNGVGSMPEKARLAFYAAEIMLKEREALLKQRGWEL